MVDIRQRAVSIFQANMRATEAHYTAIEDELRADFEAGKMSAISFYNRLTAIRAGFEYYKRAETDLYYLNLRQPVLPADEG